ncbi:tetratricopeptide repeat protein [Moritella sp.]|uniref:tetratricopeptide repeat protein n=1 Tax=Moritella sp. TaxID=78556 RepID=UPI001D49B06B|nr:tetratricopeptide repeat protein [Moritella sp.]MCJ8349387.1 sel1 repeat family protein [Moritella sp.]NQZ39296.1 sel1 repeat family protein [Moritella sp.]
MRITELSLKNLAKKLKKERSIPHSEALDLAATKAGFNNWKHYKSSSIPTLLNYVELKAFEVLLKIIPADEVEEYIYSSKLTCKIKVNSLRINQIGEHFLGKRMYVMAGNIFNIAAKMKNSAAMNSLGTMYLRGQGFEKDNKEAFNLFYQAAQLNNHQAKNNVGAMYQQGKGVEKNITNAEYWYKKADESGSIEGTSNLAWLYKFEDENIRDYNKASLYFKKAAELNDADSQFYIGMMHYNGEGVVKDNQLAIQWLSKAADKGNATAQCNLANVYHQEGLYREARFWYEEASQNGHVQARKILESYIF